jgi:hypothetical protein
VRTILVIGQAVGLFAALTLATLLEPSAARAQVLQCSPNSPPGDAVANGLFTSLTKTLNVGWTKGAASIDPLYPTDPDNPPGGATFGTGTVRVGCTSEAKLLCSATLVYTACEHINASLSAYDLVGMSQFALTFKDLASTKQNPKSLATHSNRGPDAGLVTDGVLAGDGATDWNDTRYAVIIPLLGPKYGVTVDLGAVVANICGASASCKGPLFQGDKNVYLLEYSSDASTWQCYGQFGVGSGSGLRTRGATSLSAQGCPTTLPASFGARYLRVSAYSGDGNYSVSELQAHDTAGNLLTLQKPAVGPLPAQIVSGTPLPDGTAWNDKHAVVIPNTGPAHALVIDLGAVKDVCGKAGSCASGPIVQADRNPFSLEYSTDGYNWLPFGQFPSINSDGLHTRGLAGTPPAHVSGRYFRVWALPGNGDYSVAQLSLYDTAGATATAALISVGSTVYGPEPYVTNGELAPDQSTDWNDYRYATVLRPCSTPNSICPSSLSTLPGLTAPLVVDLGLEFPVSQLTLQADRHSFQVDISSDRATWKPLYTFGIVSGQGLITRDSPAFAPVSGRYLRVYGVAGDDSNYSVSELDVFTALANTPCSYKAPDPNAGQNFGCSYDGQYTYDLSPNAPVTLSYKVYKGAIDLICSNIITGDTTSIGIADASKGAVCTASVSGPTSGSTSLTYPTGNFCAGTCQNGQGVLTYAQFPTQPQFTASNLKCSIDSDFDKLAVGLFEGVAAQAMNTVLNTVLGPRTGTPAGVTPYPASCGLSTTPPVAPVAVTGRASRVGEGRSRGRLELRGRFAAKTELALDHVTLTLDSFLKEQGIGELVTGRFRESMLPLSLQPNPGSGRNVAIFATPSKAEPRIRMEVSKHGVGRQHEYDFVLRLDGITIREPKGCRRQVARLSTNFILAESVGRDVAVSAEADWQCHGQELQAR